MSDLHGTFKLTGGRLPLVSRTLPFWISLRTWLMKKLAGKRTFLINGTGHIDANGVHIWHADDCVYDNCYFYNTKGAIIFYEQEAK